MKSALANGTGCVCALPTPVKPFLVGLQFRIDFPFADAFLSVFPRCNERQRSSKVVSSAVSLETGIECNR